MSLPIPRFSTTPEFDNYLSKHTDDPESAQVLFSALAKYSLQFSTPSVILGDDDVLLSIMEEKGETLLSAMRVSDGEIIYAPLEPFVKVESFIEHTSVQVDMLLRSIVKSELDDEPTADFYQDFLLLGTYIAAYAALVQNETIGYVPEIIQTASEFSNALQYADKDEVDSIRSFYKTLLNVSGEENSEFDNALTESTRVHNIILAFAKASFASQRGIPVDSPALQSFVYELTDTGVEEGYLGVTVESAFIKQNVVCQLPREAVSSSTRLEEYLTMRAYEQLNRLSLALKSFASNGESIQDIVKFSRSEEWSIKPFMDVSFFQVFEGVTLDLLATIYNQYYSPESIEAVSSPEELLTLVTEAHKQLSTRGR